MRKLRCSQVVSCLFFVCAAGVVGCVHTPGELLGLIWQKCDVIGQDDANRVAAAGSDPESDDAGYATVSDTQSARVDSLPHDIRVDSLEAETASQQSLTGATRPTLIADNQALPGPTETSRKDVPLQAGNFRKIPDDMTEPDGPVAKAADSGRSPAQNSVAAADRTRSLMQQTKDDLRSGRFALLGNDTDSAADIDRPNHTAGLAEAGGPSEQAKIANAPLNAKADSGRTAPEPLSVDIVTPASNLLSPDLRAAGPLLQSANPPEHVVGILKEAVPRLIANGGVALNNGRLVMAGAPTGSLSAAVQPQPLAAESLAADPVSSDAAGPVLLSEPIEPAQPADNAQPLAPGAVEAKVQVALSDVDWDAEPNVANGGRFLSLPGGVMAVLLSVLSLLLVRNRRRLRRDGKI